MDSGDPIAPDFMTLRNGTRVADRFRLGDLLEQRDDLVIFEAIDEENGFDVLMRFRPEPTMPDPRLRDAGVPQYEDHGCIGSWFGSVLDPGPGQPLADALRALDEDHVPLAELVTLGIDLLNTLDTLHSHGLVHGNLGIHSLHLTHDWGVRIVDFPDGAGPLLAEAQPFASPERQLGKACDDRGDLYTVAGLLYALGTGQPPFGLSAHLSRDGHLHRELAEHEHLPPEMYDVIASAMAKDPENRFTTASSMAEALLTAWERCRPAEEAAVLTDEEEEHETMGPPPVRVVESVWEEEPESAPSMWLPAVLLTLLCLTVAAMAGGGLLLAGGMWWATAWGPLAPTLEVEGAPVEAPVTMPEAAPALAAVEAGLAEAGLVEAGLADGALVDGALVETTANPPSEEPGVPGLAGESVRVPVSFGYDSWQAVPEGDWSQFMDAADSHQGPVRLTGHTDNVGSGEANRLMGLGRAWSVSMLMAAAGYSEGRIEIETAGEDHPIAPNGSVQGRAANRRVTAEFQGQAPMLQDLLVPAQ